MGKCLITQLAEAVSNNSLPTYNTLILNYHSSEVPTDIVVGASSRGAVIVKFSSNVRQNSSSGPVISANTEFTVATGSRAHFVVPNDLSSDNDFMVVKNVYNLESLVSYSLVLDVTQKSGIPCILYADNIVQIGGYVTDNAITSSNAKRAILVTPSSDNIFDISGCSNCQSVEIITETRGDVAPFVTNAPNSIHRLYCRWKGSVADLPANLRYLRSSTRQSTGDLVDFVTKARNAGRTNGYLLLPTDYNDNITFNGTSIVDNQDVPTFAYGGYSKATVLNWTMDTISFTNTLPSDFSKYENQPSLYDWQPYE